MKLHEIKNVIKESKELDNQGKYPNKELVVQLKEALVALPKYKSELGTAEYKHLVAYIQDSLFVSTGVWN